MTRFRAMVATLLLLVGVLLGAASAQAQTTIASPGTTGDQLLFFYDATAGRTAFLVVSNLSPATATLEIAWYAQDISRRVATQRLDLAGGANVVLDPSQVSGVSGNAGITVVTPIVPASDGQPVVLPTVKGTLASERSGPLAGGFTVADLSSGSAFGQNPLARVAVTADGKRAAPGSVVDGTTVRFQQIAPAALTIPFYFNPSSAGFTNRALLGAFEDRYAAGNFSIGPASVDLEAGLVDAAGTQVATSSLTVTGVRITDVQTLADATRLTSSGKALLQTTSSLPANANLLGLISQSLGTFGVGQSLPGYFAKETRFVDNGDGTVTDRQTGLQWEMKVDPQDSMNVRRVDFLFAWTDTGIIADGPAFTVFLAAINGGASGVGNCVVDGAGVQTGGFANHCDWRVPTLAELQTLIDTTRRGCPGGAAACIDPALGLTSNALYWSASVSAVGDGSAFAVDFSDGSVRAVDKTQELSVRAVRGGS